MHPVLRRAPRGALAVLGFHNITPTFSQPFISKDFPRRFRKLCRVLRSRYEMVTMTEGYRRLVNGDAPKKPLLALAFDDGYLDTFSTIMPIMRDEGVPGTSYIIVDSLRHGTIPWYDEFGRIFFRSQKERLVYRTGDGREHVVALASDVPARDPVFWDAVRTIKKDFPDDIDAQMKSLAVEHGLEPFDPDREPQMMRPDDARGILAGGFEVGCHSRTHPILPALDDASLDEEIVATRAELAGLVDHEVTSFCYPNGDNDARCVERARSAGYDCALTMALGANRPETWNPHQLRRVPMSEVITATWPWHTLYRVHTTLVAERDAA